jgi:hypothetical protein
MTKQSRSTNRTPKPNQESPFVKWGKKIRWDRRVKAVCKPCWELKYCPYGLLVEQFPLRENRNEQSCRIFGHDCPVFHIAEPLTETRELRNISRSIPRSVQFRVLKRENQICRQCGKAVMDDEIEFDHVIPWSKGGSSDESNIRLLCRTCNRKRQTDFESEFLVESIRDHLAEPLDVSVVHWLKVVMGFGHDFSAESNSDPTARDIGDHLNGGGVGEPEQNAAKYYREVTEFFRGKRPVDVPAKIFRALKSRWGIADGEIQTLKYAATRCDCGLMELVEGERSFFKRLGFVVRTDVKTNSTWQKL